LRAPIVRGATTASNPPVAADETARWMFAADVIADGAIQKARIDVPAAADTTTNAAATITTANPT
jgi:hypothetical protein